MSITSLKRAGVAPDQGPHLVHGLKGGSGEGTDHQSGQQPVGLGLAQAAPDDGVVDGLNGGRHAQVAAGPSTSFAAFEAAARDELAEVAAGHELDVQRAAVSHRDQDARRLAAADLQGVDGGQEVHYGHRRFEVPRSDKARDLHADRREVAAIAVELVQPVGEGQQRTHRTDRAVGGGRLDEGDAVGEAIRAGHVGEYLVRYVDSGLAVQQCRSVGHGDPSTGGFRAKLRPWRNARIAAADPALGFHVRRTTGRRRSSRSCHSLKR